MDELRSRNNYSRRVHGEKGYRRGSYTYDRGGFRGRYNYINRSRYPYRNNATNNKYFHNKNNKRIPSRPTSPVEGSEEYMNRKIEHTSAIIMRQLLTPSETITPSSSLLNKTDEHNKKTDLDKVIGLTDKTIKSGDKLANKTRKNVTIQLNAKEIREKIMNHITNLNQGRKRNFINANSSTGLDNAINHMQKQKRLEISRILRDMTSTSDFQDFTDYPSSIVPDIGIDIGELPIDVIEELRQTLNLDLENLNEAIAHSTNYDNDTCSSSSGTIEFLNDIVEVKQEPVEHESRNNAPFVQIKTEDYIFDTSQERVAEPQSVQAETMPEQNQSSEDCKQSIHHEVTIKSEEDETSSLVRDEVFSLSSSESEHDEIMETNTSNDPVTIKIENSDDSLKSFESNLRQFVENDKNLEYFNIDSALTKIDLIDMCVKHLSSYRRSLIELIANQNRGVSTSKSASEKSVATSIQQDETSKKVVKKRKLMDKGQSDVPPNIEIKQEPLEIQTILRFPKLDEKIVAIERVDNELVLATDKGNIIFVSLEDGTIKHRLGVCECTITSMKFVRGINNFIYMYIGSLEKLLRVFDFRKRQIISTSHIDDQILCMDSMWDYVFMGCKKGTLIRYSCKKGKIEFVENNTYKDVLVLQAAQEGPRRVLLIGHRQAEIYVRDAMSGLFLRSFGSTAVTPTVYSIVINQNNLYCGTAKNNILVFAFHEGQLKRKIIADDSKGISCLKIYENHLFAGCYNGSVYIYNLNTAELLLVLKGPGGSIMCMEVLNNQIIVGTLTGQLHSLSLPSDIFKY